MKGDVRSRVVIALENISKINPIEFSNNPEIWGEIENLLTITSQKGPLIINGKILKSSYENTAANSQNRTYCRHADKIFSIWLSSIN